MFEASATLDSNGMPFIRQTREPPSVYLDICAMRGIAADPAFADRFVTALLGKGGTLVLSQLSFREFATADKLDYQRKVGGLVQRIVPHIYFQHWFPEAVISEEGSGNPYPDSDLTGLRMMMTWTDNLRGPLTIEQIFGMPNMIRSLAPDVTKQRDDALRRIIGLRDKINSDPKLRRALLRVEREGRPPRATSCLSVRLAKGARQHEPNDGLDYMHAVVAAAYGDFVVLDKHWYTQLAQATVALRKAGVEAPIARAFRVGKSGVLEFLESLEKWQAPPTPLNPPKPPHPKLRIVAMERHSEAASTQEMKR